ncbi:MAG TPA: four helix bundle protein [Chitinophagaceae bacterium]|jgi:four helix bundle protein|nr:four helix bundle protein [Chitinophagaceae bacterium]
MEEKNQSFTELEVWKKARILKIELKELADKFPPEEKFRLADQLIRSSRSITANISEGHGRFTYKDQLHFCIQARGSLSETHNHLIDAMDCKYISETQFNYYKTIIDEVGRLLNGYITFLRNNIK